MNACVNWGMGADLYRRSRPPRPAGGRRGEALGLVNREECAGCASGSLSSLWPSPVSGSGHSPGDNLKGAFYLAISVAWMLIAAFRDRLVAARERQHARLRS